jgi:hypothetical protein
MRDLIRLALALAEQAAVRHCRQAAARVAWVAAVALVAGGCGIAAIACGLAALWIYAVPRVGPVGAPLVVAGTLLVLGLVVLVVMRYAMKPRRPPPSPVGVAPEVLLAETTRILKEHKGAVLIAAVLAGLVAGMNGKK